MSASDSGNSGSHIDSTLCVRCLNIPFDLFLGEQRTYELYKTRLELGRSAEHCAACNFWDWMLLNDHEDESPVILSSLVSQRYVMGSTTTRAEYRYRFLARLNSAVNGEEVGENSTISHQAHYLGRLSI
jgi:hypothetical protein